MEDTSQSLIFVVDDNRDILYHLRFILENNGFRVSTAINGKDALKKLSQLKEIPDLIISDIMMPQMNGYEFFTAVSNKPQWNRIPFVFLTAKSTPEDIRLGKMLGIDDYITKPFKKEDLIASISGKIARNQKSNLVDKEIKQILTSLNIKEQRTIMNKEEPSLCLLCVYWDDILGPVIKNYFPTNNNFSFSLNTIGKQLFHATTSIYGQDKITRAQGFLLDIENINQKGYVFFDSYKDETERYGEKQYMLSVISRQLTYFDSLKIKQVLKEISDKIKNKQEWNIEEYWKNLVSILSTDSFFLHTQ